MAGAGPHLKGKQVTFGEHPWHGVRVPSQDLPARPTPASHTGARVTSHFCRTVEVTGHRVVTVK